jgi:flagellar hook-basal body complex protein FliE
MDQITFQKGLESLTNTVSPVNQKEIQGSESFRKMLAGSLNEVNQLKLDADEAINDFAAGKQNDIHQTMISLEKADVAFQLMMQIRNKVIAAYETVMRMQA